MAEEKKSELLDKIDALERSGMAVTKEWYELWSEGLRYFFSDHDFNINRHEDWDWVVMNFIWPAAMQEIAKLAKNYPKIIALPFDSEDETEIQAAEVWQGACQWQWQENLKMRLNQIAAILCGKIFGYRVSKLFWEDKCSWDDQQKVWLGDIKYKLWNPAFFWANGDESINDGDCGTVRWVELEWAKSRYSKYADDLEKIAISLQDRASIDSGGSSNFQSWISSGSLVQSESDKEAKKKPELSKILSLIKGDFTNNADISGTNTKFVRLSDTYLKDYSERKEKQERELSPQELIDSRQVYLNRDQRLFDSATNMPYAPEQWPTIIEREWDEPNYPYGRNVLSAGEGSQRIILNPEEKEQRWSYKRWPFIVTPHYLLPFMWQGLNAVTLYKSTQDMVNVSVSHLVNNLKQFGDPKFAVEDGALAIDPKTKLPFKIMKGAGAIIRLAKGAIAKYKIEPPPAISPATLALFQMFSQDFKNLTGLQSIGRGEQLKSGTTATESQFLAISSNDRVYLQSIYEDEWVKELAKLMAEMMQKNYDVGRWLRIVGESKLAGIQQITQKLKEVRYDITVMPGTTLPFDEEKRIGRFKIAYDMFQNPVANPMMPEMLKVLDISNREKLLKEYPVYQKYRQFVQLYNDTKAGKVAPEQAVQLLTQAAVNEFQSEQKGLAAPNQEKR